MAITTFVASQILTAAQMNAVQSNDFNQTVSTKTASYTLVAADKGTRVVMNVSSASTVTVNTSLFSAGDTLTIQNISADPCTITAGTATVSSAGPLAIPQNGSGLLYFTSAGVSIFYPSAVTATASTKIGQVVSATKIDAFTTSSATFVDITDLTVSITPTAATSKVFALWQCTVGIASDATPLFNLVRDSTAIEQPNFGTNYASGIVRIRDIDNAQAVVGMFLDAPSTTSATTYKIQTRTIGPAIHINRAGRGTTYSGTSSITVFEVIV